MPADDKINVWKCLICYHYDWLDMSVIVSVLLQMPFHHYVFET